MAEAVRRQPIRIAVRAIADTTMSEVTGAARQAVRGPGRPPRVSARRLDPDRRRDWLVEIGVDEAIGSPGYAARAWELAHRLRGVLKDIGQVQLLRAVDHQAHGTIGRVLDDVGQGLRKVRVGHMGHGDQELMLEVSRRVFFHES